MAPYADFVDTRNHGCVVESEIADERSPCGPLVQYARHRVIFRDFQQISASSNDTPRYLRCFTHSHHTT